MFIMYIGVKLGLQLGEHIQFLSSMLLFHALSICGCAICSLQTCCFKMVFLFIVLFWECNVARNFMWVLYATIILILICDKRTHGEKIMIRFCNFNRTREILRLNFPWHVLLASVILIFNWLRVDEEFCFMRSNY